MSLFLLLLIGAVLVCTVLVFVIFKYKQKLKEYEAHINTLSSAVVSQSKFLSLGEIVGNITHQWKQPLNAIATIQNNMKVAILYGKGISDEKLVNSFEVTFELVEHLSSTIDTFYSFLVKHNSDVRFDIHTAIENVRKITEYTFINSNIKIKL